jgi:hypothetical protein
VKDYDLEKDFEGAKLPKELYDKLIIEYQEFQFEQEQEGRKEEAKK